MTVGYPVMLARLGPLAWGALTVPFEAFRQIWARTPAGIRARDAAAFVPGDGLAIVGDESDQKKFLELVKLEMRRSPAFHELMLKINADKAHKVTISLSRDDPRIFVDKFRPITLGRQEVDLSDLERFPVEPPADHLNATTRGEILMHGMTEVRAGARREGFDRAHHFAITAQNVYRHERGQEGDRVDDDEHERRRPDGVVEIDYDNGYSEEWIPKRGEKNSLGRIERFEP